MAPTRDKWVRRFIIPETTRHKKGFTIYKVTSVVFLKNSHEEISKVSVWKRYNDFKKLHSELSVLYSQTKIKESFPSFPKPKFFGRFEAEVIEERRECALKFLEFIGRHSYLYSSDTFIKFFETSHADYYLNDCSQSLSSDTSTEEDRHTYLNTLPNNDVSECILQPRSIHTSLTNLSASKNEMKQSQETSEVTEQVLEQNDLRYKTENEKISMINSTCNKLLIENNDSNKIASKLEDNQVIYLNSSLNTHDGSDLPQSWADSSQYILIAAAHMSAAFKHEDLTEYEEAFTQYKMGISSLRSGVESDSNKIRADIIKEKISKYLERAEKLYNRYLNCNISVLNKPISELQYYKVLKVIESVMLVKDIRQNCLSIVKAIEKLSSNKESISNYILRGEIPYMVHLHACVETETSVFLILQHLSRGKLWDFITSHYNSNNNKIYDSITATSNTDKTINGSDIILRTSDINEIGSAKLKENLNLISTNTKVQMEIHPITVNEKYTNVSTTQLLEKAQILLQSVNATLKEKLWTIPENVIHLWAAEILLALEALHQQEVIVFDLKPDNILLDDNGHVQLTYIVPRHDINLLKYKHPYSSPELCTFSPMIPLTPATDIWSFGVILYELIVGNKFQAKHPGTFQSHSIINIPNKLSENAKSLLLNILKYEPNERMTIPEIKQHPFFKDINWSSLVNTL
ncbi:Ribosomal protein S6 kinase delta-1 [Eufriesea mexicana]|uniref:Ribosomal protein S6 kinase delta-1 n=1 Tax=Eufriesea mexicana TaxID=516756 RepID=A0A310SP01_9HYME|nr:Ribosomal protein S6 kinase delta-1 [Eufriesea mexicana]